MDSYYSMLSVGKNCTVEEVTKNYRKLSLKVHPDKPGGSEEVFQRVNRAYEVLKDVKARASYDRFGFDLGDDASADDLAQEVGQHANRAVGVAAVRTAIVMVLCVGLRIKWIRALTIAACGAAVLFGKLKKDEKLEKLGYRIVVVPLVAWAAAALGWEPYFEACVYCLGFGVAEFGNNAGRGAAVGAGLLFRRFLGSNFTMFLKLITFQIVALGVCHFFFVLVAALVKELVDQKLSAYGRKFRELVAEAKVGGPTNVPKLDTSASKKGR